MAEMKRALAALCSGSEAGPGDAAVALVDAIQRFDPLLENIQRATARSMVASD
jgi:hypothetical protein